MPVSEESSTPSRAASPARERVPGGRVSLLLLSIFLISTCGLVYELLAGTLASYLLGDSVLQFSTVIGAYLFAMGVGSWLAQYFESRSLVLVFVRLQVLIGLVGGSSAALLYLAFSYTGGFRLLLYALVFLIGCLVGMEIPLVMSLLKNQLGFRELVSQVLALDYVGALVGSLLFPLVLVPRLGLIRTSFLCGLLNVVVALFFYLSFARRRRFVAVELECGLAVLVLAAGLAYADQFTTWAEEGLYSDPIMLAVSSPYQRLVVTRKKDDLRLYLNGNLQFSSRDEYRYHEALVDPALAACANPAHVLVMGGGDGLAARELLRDPRVKHVTLVDLDPEMTRLFSTQQLLVKLNGGSLTDPRLTVVNADAWVWLEMSAKKFDLAIVDFPDPSNYSVGKLYTVSFYRSLARHLNAGAAVAVQCTSPLFARQSYWCIIETIRAAGLAVRPYHLYVPSFGEWGFALVGGEPKGPLPEGLRFLTAPGIPQLFDFPRDMAAVPAEVNRLTDQVLVRYYEHEWRMLLE